MTKQALKRLLNSNLEVKLYNGCFNVVTAKAEFSRYSWELRVEVTNQALAWQCGNKSEVTLWLWQGSSGVQVDVPEELNELVEKMKKAGQMTDEAARELSRANASLFEEAMTELGTS
jgi:hypothetical protein